MTRTEQWWSQIGGAGPPGPPGPTGPAGTPDSSIVKLGVTCDVSVMIGDVVRMSGGVAIKAQADAVGNSGAIAIVEAKPGATSADLRFAGLSGPHYAGLDPTKEYFLSPSVPGGITATVPTGSGQVVFRVGRPFSATELVVNFGMRMVRAT